VSTATETRYQRLRVELEDAATRSAWVGLLGLVGGQVTQQWHFVGLVDGQVRYDSAVFAAPYSWGDVPLGRTATPQEDWAPGMAAALAGLRAEIARDGWVECGHGVEPWQLEYRRPVTTA
jgi:hypothetical protein